MSLKIISFNCQSLNVNFDIISLLSKRCDVLLLQETLLNDSNKHMLDNIDPQFNVIHVPSVRKSDQFIGRSSGGLAILWRKVDNIKCYPIYATSRIVGLKLQFNDLIYAIVNVYFTCDYGNLDSLIEYKSNFSDLANLISTENFDEIIVAGDFNCDPNKGRFFNEFSLFTESFDFYMTDILCMPPSSYTYISRNQVCSTSWLDHVLSSRSELLSNFNILYGTTFEDHVPIMFELLLPHFDYEPECISVSSHFDNSFFILWDKATDNDICKYSETLDSLVKHFSNSALMCNDKICSHPHHIFELQETFSFMVRSISVASSDLPKLKNRNFKNVPGWNDYCKDLYDAARSKFLLWNNAGRIRNGFLFDDMKTSRTNFRKAMRFCKNN